MLKAAKGSISLKEIRGIIDELGDVPDGVSLSTISRSLRNRLSSGRCYTRKKDNLDCRTNVDQQQYFVYPGFFDEAGIKLFDIGTRKYGHSPVGERCVEVVRKAQSPNFSLSALVSLNGIE